MSTPDYPPEPEPLTEQERVELWRENELLRAGYPNLEAAKIAVSDADLHQAIELLRNGCSIHRPRDPHMNDGFGRRRVECRQGRPPGRPLSSLWRPTPLPSQDLNRLVDEVAVTDKQRGKFLAIIQADKAIGSVDALRQAGVAGTAGQLRAWLKDEDELQRQARQARGWNLNRVEATAWQVATDTTHPSWDRANARILKAYHPAFRDRTKVDVEHTGADGGPIQIEKREVSLTGVLHVLAEAGALPDELAGPLRALAAARDVLPAQPD